MCKICGIIDRFPSSGNHIDFSVNTSYLHLLVQLPAQRTGDTRKSIPFDNKTLMIRFSNLNREEKQPVEIPIDNPFMWAYQPDSNPYNPSNF